MIGVGAGGHALENACGFEDLPVRTAAVLAPTVAVEDEARSGVACAEGLLEGVCDELCTHVVGEGPADDAPRTEVDDDRQIAPTVCCGDVGDVARPDLVGLLGKGAFLAVDWAKVCRLFHRWFLAHRS